MRTIPHNRPTIGLEEQEAVAQTLRSGQLAQSDQVSRFEEEFAASLGLTRECAVAASSGTAALYLALWALDAEGRDVAFPAYCCASVRHAVMMARGRESLCDVKPGQPNMDPAAVAACDIAIVPHLYGIPVRIPARHGRARYIIEDAAQALGARVDGAPVGLGGDVGIFSFYATKLITSAGQGGMLVSRERALVDKVRDFLDFDGRRDSKFRFNFQMTDVQAAMGRVQLRRLPEFVARRQEIFQFYRDLGLPLLDAPAGDPGLEPVRYRSIWLVDEPAPAMRGLRDRDIGAINPLETWELLGDPEKFPEAMTMTGRTLSLPCYPTLLHEDLRRIQAAVEELRHAA